MNIKKTTLGLCLFSVLLNANHSFFKLCTKEKEAYIFHIPHPTENYFNGYSYFFDACFHFPQLLEKAHQEKKPCILIVPDTYHTVYTTETNAPFMEGARIALAWASAFFRFAKLGNVNIRTLVAPAYLKTGEVMKHCMDALAYADQTKCQSPEQKMAQRIVSIPTATPYSLEAVDIAQEEKSVATFVAPHKNKKTIVITGVAGFLGSHLAHAYLDKDFAVIGFDNFICSTGENLQPLLAHPHFTFYEFDVSQPYTIDGNVDYIAHLASVPSPADYYKMPLETLRSGLHGAKEALKLAVSKKARILLASSSEVYGDPKVHPQSENYCGNVNPIAMRSQYDESKRGEETLAKHYFDEHQIDLRIARIFNTFGPGMRLADGRVMTNFIQAALDKKSMIIHGDGNQTRSPAYITDTINGLILLLESDHITEYADIDDRIYNIGTPKEYSINTIAHIVNNVAQKHLGYMVAMEHITHIDPTDPKVRRPDINKIQNVTGFKPMVSFEDGIEKMFLYFFNKQNK